MLKDRKVLRQRESHVEVAVWVGDRNFRVNGGPRKGGIMFIYSYLFY